MKIHTVSLIGKRPSNEDQHDIILNINSENKDLKSINYFAIYDGHGGKDISKYLKDNLSTYFISNLTNYSIENYNLFKKYIEKVYHHIQIKLEREYKNISYNIGSTALVLIMYKENDNIYFIIMNVGDCRCILCNNSNHPIQITKDHKPYLFEEKNRIENLGGKIIYDGYDWRISDLSVSRAFGDMEAQPYVTHKPEIFKYKLKKNDKFIVLGCDGLWDVLQNQEVINFVLNKLSENKKLDNNHLHSKENIAYLLGNHAIETGSTDNISIIIIFF